MELQVIMVVITATIWAIYWLGDTLFLKCHTTLCSERCEHLVASVNVSKLVLAKHPLVMCLCLHALGGSPVLHVGRCRLVLGICLHHQNSPSVSLYPAVSILFPNSAVHVLCLLYQVATICTKVDARRQRVT